MSKVRFRTHKKQHMRYCFRVDMKFKNRNQYNIVIVYNESSMGPSGCLRGLPGTETTACMSK